MSGYGRAFDMDDVSDSITAEDLIDVLYEYLDFIQEATRSDSPVDALRYVSDSVRNLIENHAYISTNLCNKNHYGTIEGDAFDKIDEFITNKAHELLIDRLVHDGDLIVNDDDTLVAGA